MTASRILFVCLLLIGVIACAGNNGTVSVSAGNHVFPEPDADFDVYRNFVEAYLETSSLPARSPADRQLNLPFELDADDDVDYRGRFLLFHGLSDSAYVWTDIARSLAARGFDVRAVLLPGHGSHPADLLDISYRQWLEAARAHYAIWNTGEQPLYLGGFSLGAVLATILALDNPDVAGLFLFSPAWHSQLNSLLRWSWLYKRFRPWLFGGMIFEDNPMKYNSIPINSGSQYYKTSRYLKRRWSSKKLDIPVLMVSTLEDSVVDVDYIRRIFRNRFTSKRKRLLLFTSDITVPAGEKEILRSSYFPDLRILNQSHLSLMNAPDNKLFGENGTQLICNGNEYPVFMACMRARGHWYGAQHTPSPDGVAVARTTYNPDYATVMDNFDAVFATIRADKSRLTAHTTDDPD